MYNFVFLLFDVKSLIVKLQTLMVKFILITSVSSLISILLIINFIWTFLIEPFEYKTVSIVHWYLDAALQKTISAVFSQVWILWSAFYITLYNQINQDGHFDPIVPWFHCVLEHSGLLYSLNQLCRQGSRKMSHTSKNFLFFPSELAALSRSHHFCYVSASSVWVEKGNQG